MPLNFSDKLALRFTDYGIDLSRFSATMERRVLSMFRKLEDDLVAKVHQYDLAGVSRESFRVRKAERLIENAREIISGSYKDASGVLKGELRELASLSHSSTVNLMNEVFTANIFTVTLTKSTLNALADRALVLGEPAKVWWNGQLETTRRNFAAQMRLGIMAGETNNQLVQRVRGKATGKSVLIEAKNKVRRVKEFRGGIMDRTTREASALVRTSTMSVSNAAMFETFKENQDILAGLEALVTLDKDTSLTCIGRSGAAWTFEGDPIPGTNARGPFPGHPPWHFKCRTILIPLTKSWEQLIEEASGKKMKVLETVPDSVRASMDGKVSGKIRGFDDWYKIKGDTVARKQLGPGRFDLWKKGKMSLPQMLDQTGRPLTIEELTKRYGKVN